MGTKNVPIELRLHDTIEELVPQQISFNQFLVESQIKNSEYLKNMEIYAISIGTNSTGYGYHFNIEEVNYQFNSQQTPQRMKLEA